MESIINAQASKSNDPVGLADFFGELVRTETRLYNDLNDRLRGQHALFASQFEFLRFIGEHTGCRVAEIATHFAIGVGAASKGVDRLEGQGWILRTRSESDRRSVLLTLTPAGAELAADAQRTFDALLADRVGAVLAADQLNAVTVALAALRTVLQRDGVGTPIG